MELMVVMELMVWEEIGKQQPIMTSNHQRRYDGRCPRNGVGRDWKAATS
jgi:hypothetical protein